MAELHLINDFGCILESFNKLIDGLPPLNKVKEDILKIKDFAINANDLNFNQRSAIVARCDNYLDGTYGKNLSNIQPIK